MSIICIVKFTDLSNIFNSNWLDNDGVFIYLLKRTLTFIAKDWNFNRDYA